MRESEGAGSENERRLTRRTAIASGAAAYAGGVLLGGAAFAARSPRRLLDELRREIRDSQVHDRLKSRLLALTGEVKAELERGSNDHARKVLRERVIPLLEDSSGRRGLSPRRSKTWVADAKRIASKIPREDGPGNPNGASVYVFNCFNEPLSGLTVAGASVGGVPAWSFGSGSRYTPASRAVPRTRSPQPGSFAIGDNSVRLPWDSYTGSVTVTIPTSGVTLDDDLILFTTLNQAILQSTRGFVLSTFPVSLS